jgi:hypothetical protein
VNGNQRRINRLLRWYPLTWRETHEDEFAALLEDSLSERPLWPRRGLDIALQGSRLRLAELSARLSTQSETPLSPARIWVVAAAIVFLSYSILFATVGLTKAYVHGFEDATVPISLVVGTVLIFLGVISLGLGIYVGLRRHSLRRSWPMIALGASLVAGVLSDWWKTQIGRGLLGWQSIDNAVASLDPLAWKSAFRTPQGLLLSPRIEGAFNSEQLHMQIYLSLNLLFIVMIAISAATIFRRLPFLSRRSTHHRLIALVAAVVTLAVTASAWLYSADVTGRRSWDVRLLIPVVITVSAIPLLMRFQTGLRKSSITV